jgi:hypothetical protein
VPSSSDLLGGAATNDIEAIRYTNPTNRLTRRVVICASSPFPCVARIARLPTQSNIGALAKSVQREAAVGPDDD